MQEEKEKQLHQQIEELAAKAKEGARRLAACSTKNKNDLLYTLADLITQRKDEILKANAEDLSLAHQKGLNTALIDRLSLTPSRIESMAEGVRAVADLPDPVGQIMRSWTQKEGLHFTKIRVPLGVIAIIYEARPNVTIDAAALCFKSSNAVLLRGGREAIHSNQMLEHLFHEALIRHQLPTSAVTLLPSDRASVPIVCGLSKYVDLIIPRGGRGLIETVLQYAKEVPVIKHDQGICHVYVDREADLEMAEKIVINAKCQRPGVCNAMETLLIDAEIAQTFLPRILKALRAHNVKIYADKETSRLAGELFPEPANWSQEYLSLELAIRVVRDVNEAIQHIEEYGSHHSDAIVTENESTAKLFMQRIDSAAVYWNASIRFTDGAVFGMGAEIGISTNKLHSRGPMGLEELTSYKYVIQGNGQIRS